MPVDFAEKIEMKKWVRYPALQRTIYVSYMIGIHAPRLKFRATKRVAC